MMKSELKEYFETVRGTGVLSTADSRGSVDAALYGRPHFMDDGTVAFIMQDRLSHENLQSNGKAVYLFKEDGPGHKGRRLYLEKKHEEKNTPRINELRRSSHGHNGGDADEKDRFLVFFSIEKVRPLVGD